MKLIIKFPVIQKLEMLNLKKAFRILFHIYGEETTMSVQVMSKKERLKLVKHIPTDDGDTIQIISENFLVEDENGVRQLELEKKLYNEAYW